MTDMRPTLTERYEFRQRLVEDLVEYLHGPSTPDEVLDELPLDRYITGILWPAPSDGIVTSSSDAEFMEDAVSGEARPTEAAPDSPVASSRMSKPSSIGMTFTVDPALTSTVTLRSRAARYKDESDGESDVWRRVEVPLPTIDIELTGTDGTSRTHAFEDGSLELFVLVRRPDPKFGTITITAVLRNTQRRQSSSELADGYSWFQVGIDAHTGAPAILDRRILDPYVPDDEDLRSSALLYRDQHSFAAGHGCSVEWPEDVVDSRTRTVQTVFVPRSEVLRAKPGDSSADLSLGFLASGGREEVVRELEVLCDEYETWLENRSHSLSDPGTKDFVRDELRPTASGNLKKGAEALQRIRAGITLLRDDDRAFEAFQLANSAMHEQRSRQDWIRSGATGPFELKDQRWRSFQIAFILINLPSLSDRQSTERDIAELLWFPAGGGKTEAYLGLIAYLIVLRRLRDRNVEGTAVIMRYTLRLLTIQQFERAAMLICSLERLRRDNDERLGTSRFGIGLWVGAASTPNTVAQARTALNKIRRGEPVETENPMQLKACPWCGARLDVGSYSTSRQPARCWTRCPRSTCDFHLGDGLPVHVVDEDVYRERPELIIGTVDKFARMAWDGSTATLFGRVENSDIGPDLIIQDELHLISGPLGSTVGLFETAVDLAAGRDVAGSFQRPKLIASTATIRRAEGQINSVFARDSALFPPPGINPDDSFFAEPSSRLELGSREYLGVMAPGTSQTTLMVRVYASLLHTTYRSRGTISDEVLDPYWTLIGYFNSLRVLGSAYLQVSDDVGKRLDLLATRSGLDAPREIYAGTEELTSRRASSDIPETLKLLESGLTSERKPLDVVLATNMISVGLDVDRLGLMTVMGQPPSSAEYIQATSRVGRKHPGLVVTIFNTAKSRDRSHYESFNDFHGSLYRAVEATSATPFATRSRDRALHAAFVAAVRMLIPEMRGEEHVKNFRGSSPAVDLIRRRFLDRVLKVAGEDARTATDRDLAELVMNWEQADHLTHYGKRNEPLTSLLADASTLIANPDLAPENRLQPPWSTPRSMRDVDAETGLYSARMPSSTIDLQEEN